MVERQLVQDEAVLAQQVLGLVEAQLARRGCRGEIFEGRARDRLEGAEVRVMEQPATLEPVDDAEDLAIALAGGPDDELGCCAGHRQRARQASPRGQEPPRVLELGQQIA